MLRERLTDTQIKMISEMRHWGCENETDNEWFTGTYQPTHEWLRFWECEKASLAEPFEDGLILTREVEFKQSSEELTISMERFCQDELDYFLGTLSRILGQYNDIVDNPEYVKYHYSPEKIFAMVNDDRIGFVNYYTFHQFLRYRMCVMDNLTSNTYHGINTAIHFPDGKTYALNDGCKLFKALGRLAKACGADVYEEFEALRIKHSQILNERNVKGTLCLSIHPLDYMTASYNENDWRSCMHWLDGEFRRGVIEMMNSNRVVCAYLESAHEYVGLGPYTWNSKKWREFFIVSPELIAGIKGYPYWNRDLEDITLEWLRELYAPVFGEYESKMATYSPRNRDDDVESDEGTTKISNMIFRTGSAMYNDFYGENVYHMYLRRGLGEIRWQSPLYYSGPSQCVWCGEATAAYFDNEGSFVCGNCITVHYCNKCGEMIRNSDDLIVLNGEEYCYDCYQDLPRCDICEETFDDNFSTYENEFYIGEFSEITNKTYRVSDDTVCVCDACLEESVFREGVSIS